MKLIHTADWQLGAPFSGFGEKADALRAVRLQTFRLTLERARSEEVDGFLIAGDLFEDNQVGDELVRKVFDLFGAFSDVPVFILPGNHDPVSGPGCVWLRAPFNEPPAHVTVLRDAAAHPLGEGWLLASPLTQKKSPRDPSLRLAELARGVEGSGPRVGITHGSPAIEGKHQPDDHPIHLEAATRAGLDYLALGHWHRWQVFDGGRMVMPGTPEPEGFDALGAAGSATESRASGPRGRGALVQIAGEGEEPTVTPLETATLKWIALDTDLLDWESTRARLEENLSDVGVDPEQTVVRLTLRGTPSSDEREVALAWIRERLGAFFVSRIDDRTLPSLSEAERKALRRERPLVAQVMNDLEAAVSLVSGKQDSVPAGGLSLRQLESLAEDRKLDWREFDEAFFRTAQELLYRELREVAT